MLRLLHLLIVWLYLALPAIALIWVVLSRRRPDRGVGQATSLTVTFVAGLAIAVAVCLFYARAFDGHLPARQVLLATYFATSLLLLLRCFDVALLWMLRRLVGLRGPGPASIGRAFKLLLVLLTRTAILFCVGLPFVIAAIMTYRPKVDAIIEPGFAHEDVAFTTDDGVKITGWWAPADDTRRARLWEQWGRETVLICPGMGGSDARTIKLARQFIAAGFNVLAIDFRGHGKSGGQLSGFGVLEKRDVLTAVAWLKSTRPEQSEKILGLGMSNGATALILAAADGSRSAQSIDAIALYAGYDNLPSLLNDYTDYWTREPIRFLTTHLALPLASLHVGVNLSSNGPDKMIDRLWPRPVLFVHGEMDDLIPFERGQSLFEAAQQPKYHLWFTEGSHSDIVTSESAARIVTEFFKTAKPVPVI